MPWAYNQIDVKISPYSNILGELNPNDNNIWTPLSAYGLLRGRPKVTPSTVDSGNQTAIPGRSGNPYPINKRRGNASLEFEVLVVNSWPYAGDTLTIEQRVDRLRALAISTKRVTYKEPGRDYTTFFVVYNTTVTEQDADENVSVLTFKMEVYPFKFDFAGNEAIQIAVGTEFTFDTYAKYSTCYPIYEIRLPNGSTDSTKIIAEITDDVNARVYTNEVAVAAYSVDDNKVAYIDTDKMLVYAQYVTSGVVTGVSSRSQYLNGDIGGLIFPKGTSIKITNNLYNPIRVYPRSGIEI